MPDPDLTPEALKRLCERLAADDALPFCPYDRRSPEYWTAPDDKPCKVCGMLNEDNAPDLCNGTGSRIMAEAAAAISGLMAERDALAGENAGLKAVFEAGLQVQDQYRTRAEQAEAKLREIAEICATQAGMTDASADKGKSLAASHVRGKALDRIATIARSTSQGGEG